MAKISAEEKVFTDFEMRSQISTEDKPFSVPHVSTSIPPLKKTDESIARPLESVIAKYEAEPATIDGVNMQYETTINHLQVMDMHERVCIDMAKVFSTKTLNVSKTAIATDEI
eukprot:gene2088-2364_t